MQRILFALIGLVLIGAVVVTVLDAGKPPPPEHGGRTSERVSARAQELMVAGPMARVEKKDMAGAARAFEADLAKARAKGGLRAGDLLTAYGEALIGAEHPTEALPYLQRAVAAYRVADPGGPELAVGLTNYAYALFDLDQDHPTPEALAALREVLAIREKTLGRNNAETAITLARLGEWEGLPALTHGDPARIAAAAAKVRTGIALLPRAPNTRESDLRLAYRELVQVYALNGDVAGTFQAARELVAAYPNDGAGDLTDTAEIFEKAGDTATGRRLRDAFAIPDPEPEAEPGAPPTLKNAGKLR